MFTLTNNRPCINCPCKYYPRYALISLWCFGMQRGPTQAPCWCIAANTPGAHAVSRRVVFSCQAFCTCYFCHVNTPRRVVIVETAWYPVLHSTAEHGEPHCPYLPGQMAWRYRYPVIAVLMTRAGRSVVGVSPCSTRGWNHRIYGDVSLNWWGLFLYIRNQDFHTQGVSNNALITNMNEACCHNIMKPVLVSVPVFATVSML